MRDDLESEYDGDVVTTFTHGDAHDVLTVPNQRERHEDLVEKAPLNIENTDIASTRNEIAQEEFVDDNEENLEEKVEEMHYSQQIGDRVCRNAILKLIQRKNFRDTGKVKKRERKKIQVRTYPYIYLFLLLEGLLDSKNRQTGMEILFLNV